MASLLVFHNISDVNDYVTEVTNPFCRGEIIERGKEKKTILIYGWRFPDWGADEFQSKVLKTQLIWMICSIEWLFLIEIAAAHTVDLAH